MDDWLREALEKLSLDELELVDFKTFKFMIQSHNTNLENFRDEFNQIFNEIVNEYPTAIMQSYEGGMSDNNYILTYNKDISNHNIKSFDKGAIIDNNSIVEISKDSYHISKNAEVKNSALYGITIISNSKINDSLVQNCHLKDSLVNYSILNRVYAESPIVASNCEFRDIEVISVNSDVKVNIFDNLKAIDVSFFGKNRLVFDPLTRKEIIGDYNDRTVVLENSLANVKIPREHVLEIRESLTDGFLEKTKKAAKALAIGVLTFMSIQGNAVAQEMLNQNQPNNIIEHNNNQLDYSQFNVENYTEYDVQTGEIKLLKHHTNSIRPDINGYLLSDGSPDPKNANEFYEIIKVDDNSEKKYNVIYNGVTFKNITIDGYILSGDGCNNLSLNIEHLNEKNMLLTQNDLIQKGNKIAEAQEKMQKLAENNISLQQNR